MLITQCVFLFVLTGGLEAQFFNFDKTILEDIADHRSANTTDFYLAISNANNYVCLRLPIGIMATGLLTHSTEIKQRALYIGEGIMVSSLLTKSLKNIVQRPRPFESDTTLIPAEMVTGYSFPSGHTSEAFSTATALTIAYPKWYVIVPAYLWAAGVGYSRLYLGVHYPTDVIAGALLGAGSAWITYKVNKWIQDKPQNRLANMF
ncbi:MAG: phosphatase PAP2 family protein [Bacteroidetes bacterium]|nr:phosphatase PAP2 family protein [Bacteroidota bacterium]